MLRAAFPGSRMLRVEQVGSEGGFAALEGICHTRQGVDLVLVLGGSGRGGPGREEKDSAAVHSLVLSVMSGTLSRVIGFQIFCSKFVSSQGRSS